MNFVMYTDSGVAIHKRHILALLGIHKVGNFRKGSGLFDMDKDVVRRELRELQKKLGVELYHKSNRNGRNGAMITDAAIDLVNMYADYVRHIWGVVGPNTLTLEEIINERERNGVGTPPRSRNLECPNEPGSSISGSFLDGSGTPADGDVE